jgi:hypothetical protein
VGNTMGDESIPEIPVKAETEPDAREEVAWAWAIGRWVTPFASFSARLPAPTSARAPAR